MTTSKPKRGAGLGERIDRQILGFDDPAGFQSGQHFWISDVTLEGEWLIAERRVGKTEWLPAHNRTKPARIEVLDQFVRLQSPEGILAFAKRWGMLGLCQHGLPWSHAGHCPPRGYREGAWRERVDEWQSYILKARALQKLTLKIVNGKHTSKEDWKDIFPDLPASYPEKTPPEFARDFLLSVINHWLGLADSKPRLYWDGKTRARFAVGGNDLFANLAVGMALWVCRSGALAVCSSCADTFTPARKPAETRRSYCHACRDAGIPQRDAARDSRLRRRQRP